VRGVAGRLPRWLEMPSSAKIALLTGRGISQNEGLEHLELPLDGRAKGAGTIVSMDECLEHDVVGPASDECPFRLLQ
jgi:hypothetical protein